jgi:hypothetical protein
MTMTNNAPGRLSHPSGDDLDDENSPTLLFDTIPDPTKEEIIAQLKKAAVFGTVDEKKKFVKDRVLPHRSELVKAAGGANEALKALMENTIPASEAALRKIKTAPDIANILYVLHGCLASLKASPSARSVTRTSLEFDSSILDPILADLRGAIDVAKRAANEEKLDKARSAMVKLKDQRERGRKLAGLLQHFGLFLR